MKKSAILAISIIALMLAAISATVYAQTVTLYIGSPSTTSAVFENPYWIGAFPITITSTSGTYSGDAYCLTPGGTISIGGTYTADESAAPDNNIFDAISYVLSWNPPTDGTSGAIDQVAIWELYGQMPTQPGPQYSDFTLDQSIIDAGALLASQVKSMNVAYPESSTLTLSPSSSPASPIPATPGEKVTFQVQLTPARQNVQIDFSATLQGSTLDSTYVSPTSAYTDVNGQTSFSVTVPSNAPSHSIITVTASTKTVWPEFLDLTGQQGQSGTQDIIGTSPTLDLAKSYSVSVSGSIYVLPESAYGAFAALAACAAGFIIYYKRKPQKKLSKL